MPGALYLCYFGLREPLVQTQVLPYLRELARGGVRMSLLTFEPQRWTAESIAEWRARLRADGIEWHMLPYHKRPSLPAKLYDIFAGALRAASIVRRERLDILHGRSHVGAFMGALAKKLTGAKLIFDVRGLLAEEYAESGNWRVGGLRYRLTKAAERWLLRSADGFVVLTERAKETLSPGGAVEVIPCCVDHERFADAPRAELGLAGRTVYVYAGTLGGYYLAGETADLLAAARERDPRTFALVLTRSGGMAEELERRGFTKDDYRVLHVAPEEVPKYLRAADVGLMIVRPSSAHRAMSPTKFAEYLASGIPVIATAGIGDVDGQIAESRVGVSLPRLDRAAYDDALRAIDELRRDPGLAERCRDVARRFYDLRAVGSERYRRLYESFSPRRGEKVPKADEGCVHVLALATYPVEAASSRYRIVQFIEPLASRGLRVTFSPFLDASLFAALYQPRKLLPRLPLLLWRALMRVGAIMRSADVVFVQREAMLFGPPLIELLARPFVLDLDDATWVAYKSPVYGRLASLLKWPAKTDRLIRWARVVTCGNPTIATYAQSRGAKTVMIPTVVDTRVFRPREPLPAEVPVIGWIGSHGTYPYLHRLLPILDRLGQEVRFERRIIGSGRADLDARPWRMDAEAEDFRSLDIGLYPIDDDEWSAGKSGFKAVQYMASGVPFVMSPVGVCATMGVPGETHFLATTGEEWLDALRRLARDPELRRRMGAAGRAYAERHYSLDAQADALAAVLREAAT